MLDTRRLIALLLTAFLAFGVLGLTGCAAEEPATTTPAEEPAEAAAYPEFATITEGKLVIGSDTAFPPFEEMKGDVAEGFDVDLANAIGEELGVEVEFMTVKFDTLIPQLKAGGTFDLIMSAMTINDDRKQEIDFSEAYIDSNQSIAVSKGSGIKAAADLDGKKVGVQSGTTGEAWAKENLKGAEIVPFDDTLAAFSALQAGKVVAIVNDLPVSAWIVTDPARNAEIIEEVPTGEQYGIGVSKDNPELKAAIDAALTTLRENGTYDEIYAKWFGEGAGK